MSATPVHLRPMAGRGRYAERQAGRRSRDMVLSLGVIGAVGGVIYIFVPHDENADPRQGASTTASSC